MSKWIHELPKVGKYTFTLEEAVAQFPSFTRTRIHQEISRQIAKRLIISAWRGFYAVVLHEYGLEGTVPPSEYIDQLMKYLDRRYYVALLSAARMHGSSHQNPQSYMIMIEGGSLRSSVNGDVQLAFFTRQKFPHEYIEQTISRSGTISYSSKELTALDLVARMENVGGINRVAEVIHGLAEEGLNFQKVKADYFQLGSIAHIQRLGYILDEELGYHEEAEALVKGAKEAKIEFRQALLVQVPDNAGGRFPTQQMWKITINKRMEIE